MGSDCDAEERMDYRHNPVLNVEQIACNRFFLSSLVFLDLAVVRVHEWREGLLKFADCKDPSEEEQECPCEHGGGDGQDERHVRGRDSAAGVEGGCKWLGIL